MQLLGILRKQKLDASDLSKENDNKMVAKQANEQKTIVSSDYQDTCRFNYFILIWNYTYFVWKRF